MIKYDLLMLFNVFTAKSKGALFNFSMVFIEDKQKVDDLIIQAFCASIQKNTGLIISGVTISMTIAFLFYHLCSDGKYRLPACLLVDVSYSGVISTVHSVPENTLFFLEKLPTLIANETSIRLFI